MFGSVPGKGFRWLSYGYAAITYRAFDRVYVLGDEAKAALARRGITDTDTLPLGVDSAVFTPAARDPGYRAALGLGRSEEHTSELQSLMRISYAVFCLKKKKTTNTKTQKKQRRMMR